MHIKARKISFLGMLLALSIVLQLLGSYLGFSTLTFLMLSALCLSIAIYETSLSLGAGFLTASIALSFLLSPNKFYCLTYSCLCIYIFLQEVLRTKSQMHQHPVLIWIIKLLFFNCCFLLPCLIFFKELMFASTVDWHLTTYAGIITIAQIFLILFDLIYQQLIPGYWNRLKHRLHINL